MKIYDQTWLKPSVAADRLRVARRGTWDGMAPTRYFDRCRAYHQSTGTLMMLSRDEGKHSSGWQANPDCERNLHLSLSFRDPTSGQPVPRDKKLTREWVGLLFGPDAAKLWCEPPYSAQGKALEVWHYRLFADAQWRPLKPRGEPYSRRFTEIGWKTWSEVRSGLEEAREQAIERLLS